MCDPFSFRGTITRDQFTLVHRLMTPWWGTVKSTPLWIFVFMLISNLTIRDGADSILTTFIASLLLAVPLTMLAWLIALLGRHRQWHRLSVDQREITGTIGEAGLEWNTPVTTATYPWSKIVKIRQHPDMLLIYYSARCAFYLPKNFFTSEADWNKANALGVRQSLIK
jgi:hypothetical protein